MINGILPQKRKTVNGLTVDDSPTLVNGLNSNKKTASPAPDAGTAVNESILRGLGINTVLTPKGKKRLKGLRGGSEELATLLGE